MLFSNNQDIKQRYGLDNVYLGIPLSMHLENLISAKLYDVPKEFIFLADSEDSLIVQLQRELPQEVYIFYEIQSEDTKTYIHGTTISSNDMIIGYDDSDSPIFHEELHKKALSEIEQKQKLPANQVFEELAKTYLGNNFSLSHEVCIKIDNKNRIIQYVDSYGTPIAKSLKSMLMERFSAYKLICSDAKLQSHDDNSNCFLFAVENMVRLAHNQKELFNPSDTGYIKTIELTRNEYAQLLKPQLEEELQKLNSKTISGSPQKKS